MNECMREGMSKATGGINESEKKARRVTWIVDSALSARVISLVSCCVTPVAK